MALTALYREHTGAGIDEAAAWLRRLSDDGRYHVDVWATG
jgi:cytochrome P450 / NADPH-cytochrome P450 reductase